MYRLFEYGNSTVDRKNHVYPARITAKIVAWRTSRLALCLDQSVASTGLDVNMQRLGLLSRSVPEYRATACGIVSVCEFTTFSHWKHCFYQPNLLDKTPASPPQQKSRLWQPIDWSLWPPTKLLEGCESRQLFSTNFSRGGLLLAWVPVSRSQVAPPPSLVVRCYLG
jgi:hypothetical protein